MTGTTREARLVQGVLSDGRAVEVRPAGRDVHAGLLRMFDELPAGTLRSRFFGAGRRVGRVTADRVCEEQRNGRRALVALLGERVVGLAEYQRTADPVGAEVGLAVTDDVRREGVAALLLGHLVAAARGDGLATLTATTFWTNHEALKVFSDLGLETTRCFEGYEVHCTVLLRA